MSISERTGKKVPVQVFADPATETFIIDHVFRMIRTGTGNFSCELFPGLYKFKFRSGISVREIHYEVPADAVEPVRITAPALEFSSAAPLRNTRRVSMEQLDRAEKMSSGVAKRFGQGSFLFVFVRSDSGEVLAREESQNLTVHTLDGTLITSVATSDTPSQMSGCLGLLAELDPGAYRLRSACEGGTIELIVIMSPGWHTQVFLMGGGTSDDSAACLATASVLLSRGPFRAEDEMLRYAEAARHALSRENPNMPRHLLQQFLDDKFENPMLGIYAAQALQGPDDSPLLNRLISTLDRLIPGHPDVMALSLKFSNAPPVGIPPMLRRSWTTIIDATLEGKAQIEDGSLAARIPASLLGGTPWLIWPEAELLPVRNISEMAAQQLESIEQILNDPAIDVVREKIELNAAEEALYSYLDRRVHLEKRITSRSSPAQQLSNQSLARTFRTTLPNVQAAVEGLTDKLRKGKSTL